MGLHVFASLALVFAFVTCRYEKRPTGWPCFHQRHPIPQYATTCFPSFLSLVSQVFTEGMKLCQLSLVRATQDMSRPMSRLVKCTLHILQALAACQEHTHWWQSKAGNVLYALVPCARECKSFWGRKGSLNRIEELGLKELCLVQPKTYFPLRTSERTVLRTTVGFYQAPGVLLQERALEGTDSYAMWITKETGVN